jgi:hypothetical protein
VEIEERSRRIEMLGSVLLTSVLLCQAPAARPADPAAQAAAAAREDEMARRRELRARRRAWNQRFWLEVQVERAAQAKADEQARKEWLQALPYLVQREGNLLRFVAEQNRTAAMQTRSY